MHIFKNTNYDFLRWRWHALAISWIIIIAGIITIATKGIPKGVEFAGGTVVITEFEQTTSVEQVRNALDKNFPGGGQNVIVQAYGAPTDRKVLVRVPSSGAEAGQSLSRTKDAVVTSLQKAGVGFALAEVRKPVIDAARRSGVLDTIGEDNVFHTLDEAVAWLAAG